ncbi:MAG TPA: tRNA lysidine(34) synthetase TilS, partial [Calditrichia bacterium]|nr:tRNA lysidine(34) synthetase TilS [Calditrichia bacterium]
HALRAESAADARFAADLAASHGLPFWSERIEVAALAARQGEGLEAAGRRARETFLTTLAARHGFAAVATAHHLDDQVETVLMNLLRGSGVGGLAGIHLRRGPFCRPLLFASKAEIRAFAGERKLAFREDPSNRDTRFHRNKIRHRLIPFLAEEFGLDNPRHFLNTALSVQDWLPEVEQRLGKARAEALETVAQKKIALELGAYRQYFSWIQKMLLESILADLGRGDVSLSSEQFAGFQRWLQAAKPGRFFDLGGQVRVFLDQEKAVFFKGRQGQAEKVCRELFPGDRFRSADGRLSLAISRVEPPVNLGADNRRVEYLDCNRLTFPLLLRNWEPGDRFQPLGMGRTKKISDFLTDARDGLIPKKRALVLESGSEIAAVPGYRIAEKFKISELSTSILRIEIQTTDSESC